MAHIKMEGCREALSSEDAACHIDVPLHKLIQSGKQAFFNNPLLSDIKLVCPDGRTLHCHSVILASASQRFAAVLKPGSWTPGQELPVSGVDADALVTLVRAFYTAECPLQLDTLPYLYDAAVKLQVPSLPPLLEQFASSCVCAPDSALQLLQRCGELGPALEPLAEAALDWVTERAAEVLPGPAFGGCSLEAAGRVCRGLARRHKLLAMQAALCWLSASPSRPPQLLPLADLAGFEPESLLSLAASGASLADVLSVLGLAPAPPPATAARPSAAADDGDVKAHGAMQGRFGGGGTARTVTPPLDLGAPPPPPPAAAGRLAGDGGGVGSLLGTGAGAGAGSLGAVGALGSGRGLRLLPLGHQDSQGALRLLPVAARDATAATAPPPPPLGGALPLLQPLPLGLTAAAAHDGGDAAATAAALGLHAGLLPLGGVTAGGAAGGDMLLGGGIGLGGIGGLGGLGGVSGGRGGTPRLAAGEGREGSGSGASTTSGAPPVTQPAQPRRSGPRAAGGGGGSSGGGGGRRRRSREDQEDEDYQPGRDSDEEGGWGGRGRGGGGGGGGRARAQTAYAAPPAAGGGGEADAGAGGLSGGNAIAGGGGGGGATYESRPAGPRPSWRPGPPKGICHVEGCGASLLGLRAYYQRHNTCEFHAKADVVLRDGVPHRFCQQCGRFHPLSEFDGPKRSCRVMLQRHYDRHCSRRSRALDAERELKQLL